MTDPDHTRRSRRRPRRRGPRREQGNPKEPPGLPRLAQRVVRELDALIAALLPEREGSPLAKPPEFLEIPVQLRLEDGGEAVEERARLLVAALQERLTERERASLAYVPGRVYCLRCESSVCEHGIPPEPRAVFAGYGQTGRPEWTDLSTVLAQRDDPRLERLFGSSRELVALVLPREDVYADLLPGFEGSRQRYLILAQLCVGWFRPQRSEENSPPAALTVQVVRHEEGSGRGALGLNLLATACKSEGPPGRVDEDQLPGVTEALRAVRRELNGVKNGRRGRVVPSQGVALRRLAGRCFTLLREAARTLEHRTRIDGKRTRHAQQRARSGARPTAKAFEDARSQTPERLLEDRQERTVVVLGARSRVHFFTVDGRHVSSVVYPGHVVKSRTQQKRWTPLASEVATLFLQRLQAGSNGS